MSLVIGLTADAHASNNPSVPDSATLLLIADTQATYVASQPFNLGPAPVSANQLQGKIYPLPHGFCCAFCDDYHWSGQIATYLGDRMSRENPFKPGFRDKVKLLVDISFEYAMLWHRPEFLRNEYGITVKEYLYDKKLDPMLRTMAQQALGDATKNMPAELIIAGQTLQGPLLLKANGGGHTETSEFFVSGGPSESALSWLNFRQQNNQMSVARSYLHVQEAKKFCELQQTVGRRTEVVLMPTGCEAQMVQDRGSLTENWLAEFALRPTDILESPDRKTSLETALSISLSKLSDSQKLKRVR
jgi:hypothetical protein